MQLLKLDDLVRVGRNYDGGYVISKSLIEETEMLLSFGINDDWSFEMDVYKKFNIKCIAYDFSITRFTFFSRCFLNIKFFFGDIIKRRSISFKRFSEAYKNLLLSIRFNGFFIINKFLSRGLDKETHDNFSSLKDIIKKQNLHENVFLKVDIEGYEYQIVEDIVSNSQYFKGIAMEIHEIHARLNQFEQVLEQLSSKYFIYHIHANNYGSLKKIANFPDVVEISCIRKDLVKYPSFFPDLSHLPITGKDFPNDPVATDFKWQI